MSDSPQSEAPKLKPTTAGAMLRDARVAKGLHIAALAASIKVAPRKLELLEADQFDELPDATFTRALAHTVCRSLKIDPAPVLALLPTPVAQRLPQANAGLNAPFQDHGQDLVPEDLQFLKSPIVLGAAGLLIAAALIYLVPLAWFSEHGLSFGRSDTPVVQASDTAASQAVEPPVFASAPEVPAVPAASAAGESPVASAPVAIAPSSIPAASTVAQAPDTAPALGVSSTPPMQAASASALLLSASGDSWVEVVDARGVSLVSRQLQSGESLELDGKLPLRVKIGNAAVTQVVFKGSPVELAPSRDNVVRLVLK